MKRAVTTCGRRTLVAIWYRGTVLDPSLDAALEKTSRSFALSLRALPKETRACVALAYLLARAADTVADTELVARDARRKLLARLGGLIRATPADDGDAARRE